MFCNFTLIFMRKQKIVSKIFPKQDYYLDFFHFLSLSGTRGFKLRVRVVSGS